MSTKQYSYQNYPIVYKVTILGQDVTQYLDSIDNIESALDYPRLQEFRLSEATFRLKNPDNLFAPYNANNFFVTNGSSVIPPIQPDGYRATVRLDAGYHIDGQNRLETIYVGQVNDIQLNARSSLATIVCTDEYQQIRDQSVTDFGLEKKMEVEAVGSGLHGNYAFYSGLTPFSLESASSPGLTRKQFLNTEGPLDSTNFQEVPEDGIQTEGGRRSTDPVIQFKAPYRDRRIQDLIPLLLNKYGITSSDIALPVASDLRYWSNLGKPFYEPLFSDLNNNNPGTWQWPGIITDMLADTRNDIIYMLVSQTGSPIRRPILGNTANRTPQPKPRLLKWNLRNDQREEIIEIAEGASSVSEECWRFASDSTFSTFYVLGCQPVYIGAPQGSRSNQNIRGGFQLGSYSSSEYHNTINSTVRVHRIRNAQSSPSRDTYFNPSNSGIQSVLPQLACYYHIGNQGTTTFELRQGNIPDSRRAFHLRGNGDLIYGFAIRDKFGVAKGTAANTATEIISARADKNYNSSSFAFAVDESNSHVYFAYSHINKGNNSSRAKIVRGDIT